MLSFFKILCRYLLFILFMPLVILLEFIILPFATSYFQLYDALRDNTIGKED